ncbi:SMI1/KNR4 family protein [Methylomicrobium lacus]|uniref:SMI1/KNR4 family protein n=1 Tax=Methylomicrobium lacus TaxID=136992 RepID=UPI0035A84D3E
MTEIIKSAKKSDVLVIKRLENRFGFHLPEVYKYFLLMFDGGEPILKLSQFHADTR